MARWLGLLLSAVIAAGLVRPVEAAAVCPKIDVRRELNILIPAYIYPSVAEPYASLWNRILADVAIARKVGFKIVVVVNPDNGEFHGANADYTRIIDRLDAAGASVIGYVHSGFGRRPVRGIVADIEHYGSFYPKVRGVFVDEAQLDLFHIDDYTTLRRAAIRAFGGTAFVVANAPGVQLTDPRHREIFDLTIAFEDIESHLAGFTQQRVVKDAEPNRIAYIVNAVAENRTAAQQQVAACEIARSLRASPRDRRNAGYWVLTTDRGDHPASDTDNNAYDTLGTAHDAFLQATCWINSLQPCPH